MALKYKTHNRAPVADIQRQSMQPVLTEHEPEQRQHPANVLQRPAAALRPADILALQRTVGNRVVQRMLYSGQPVIQRIEDERPLKGHSPGRPNRTGLPDGLKSGVESLSGISLDDVRVHYNSAKPATLNARAYTQGTDIFLGPNEEEHLPHEAWHVVQQRQGRVQPTIQLKAKGISVNDDASLEREADVMGSQAARMTDSVSLDIPHREHHSLNKGPKPITHFTIGQPIQRVEDTLAERKKLWSWLERKHLGGVKGEIPRWRETNMAKFWPMVEAILEPLKTKASTAQNALNNIAEFMLRPDPTQSGAELDALVKSSPEIEARDCPVLKTGNNAEKLDTLQKKLNWLVKPVNWAEPLMAEINRKKENLEFGHQWQIYGEAILSELQGRDPKIQHELWKTTAGKIAEEIKKDTIGAVNTWLDDIIPRADTLNTLWEEGTRTIGGTYGTIPQATIKLLFMNYRKLTSREILTAAVEVLLAPKGKYGGVKILTDHPSYASELKLRELDGERVLSTHATPTTLDRIGSTH